MNARKIIKRLLKLEKYYKNHARIAGEIGVKEQTIRNWEAGSNSPAGLGNMNALKKIAEENNVEVE